jgi:hypothetical protein
VYKGIVKENLYRDTGRLLASRDALALDPESCALASRVIRFSMSAKSPMLVSREPGWKRALAWCRQSRAYFRIAHHSGAMHNVTRPTFLAGQNQTQVTASTQEITAGSRTFQPLIQSQRVKNTSPKAVMRVKSKLAFGRM